MLLLLVRVVRNFLAFLAILPFISGPIHYSIASYRLLRAWWCLGEGFAYHLAGTTLSDTCAELLEIR